MSIQVRSAEEADVVIVGYGGAGAVAAITAHDAGAKVVILEKQPADTPTKTNHTPSTRLCGGGWFCPTDAESAARYLENMAKIANESFDADRREMTSVFARYLVENADWFKSIGGEVGGEESLSPTIVAEKDHKISFTGGRQFFADFPELPGADKAAICFPKVNGKFRSGAALFKPLEDAVNKRNIPVIWETAGKHLLTENGNVTGVVGQSGKKTVAVRASRGVVLTCGGFEFNNWLKENYLRVNPVHFYGCQASTGDGIDMVMEVGASLWHMNSAAWRVTMMPPGAPSAFGTQRHEVDSIIVDKRGVRFTNERFKMHAFGYELTNYDCYAMCYPRVPCYWIFDEKRRKLAPIASLHGACNPPGGVMGDMHCIWSADNQQEIDRGWIMKANTLDELANKIKADPDNNGLMTVSTFQSTVKRYNELCRGGVDLDFHKAKDWLHPLEDPPYYAVKLWPGGPNTQGGPRRNSRGQVLRVDGSPIPGLYAAGELGSVFGMFYQGGGNVGECMAFGRISGGNAAEAKRRK